MSTFKEIENKLNSVIDEIRIKALKALEIQSERTIRKNFEVGGRPKWIPSKKTLTKKGRKISGNKFSGSNTLIDSGNLSLVTAKADLSNNTVTLTTDARTRAYARIHQEGGTINMPPRTSARRKKRDGKSVFASKHRDTGKQKKVDVSFSKGHTIKIPARPYMTFDEAGKRELLDAVVQGIKFNSR